MSNWKYHAKFVGKYVTYLGIPFATAGLITMLTGQVTFISEVATASGFIAMTVGSATHEYSE